MTPAVEAALEAPRTLVAGLLSIALSGYTIRLCDGGVVTWGSDVFRSRDATYGTIGEIETISEGVGDSAPALEIMLRPPTIAAANALLSIDHAGGAVRLWLASIDRDSGEVIPDPILQFAGELDAPALEVAADNSFGVRIPVVSVFERLMEPDEGVRMSDGFHQTIFPGELGMANMTATPIEDIWGPGDIDTAPIYVG